MRLDDHERDEVGALVTRVLLEEELWDPVTFADRAARVSQHLPVRMREFLTEVRVSEADIAVVSNLPLSEDLPPTPAGWEMAVKTGAGRAEEVLHMICGAGLAEPFSWSDQQDGRMVHDVCPSPGEERSLTSASSELTLALHTEDVHHPCRGDYVSLFCLRNPDAVGTTYVRVGSIDVPDDVRAVLNEDRFRFFADDSHVNVNLPGDQDSQRMSTVGPIVFGPSQQPYLRIDLDFTDVATPGDDTADAAMRRAFDSLRGSVESVVLSPGDLIFLDNYQVVHGRAPFVPRYDGNDRWLKRVNLIRDVRRLFVETRARSRVLA
ncbi:hypothetical protein ALI144C_35475 [Actinosynnema sp. ALI-1.44]|nr:hypothetical protein ALI144C_35475 [Actinosynnema sp. ALI-1.44]